MNTFPAHELVETELCRMPGCGENATAGGLCERCHAAAAMFKRRPHQRSPLLPQARALALAYVNFLEARRALRVAYEDLRSAVGAG